MMCTFAPGNLVPIAMSGIPLTQLPADVLAAVQATNAPPPSPPESNSVTELINNAENLLAEAKATQSQCTAALTERPHAVAVAEQDDAPLLPPPSHDSDDETEIDDDDEVVVVPVRRAAVPQLVCKHRLHDVTRPPLVFGGAVVEPGKFPLPQFPPPPRAYRFTPFEHKSRELGYTVLVRHNANDWVRNLVADAVTRYNNSRELPSARAAARAELAWRRRALTEFDIEMEALRIAWRNHYGVTTNHNPTRMMMVVDVALLSRYIIDRYGIQTSIGRVAV